MLQGRRRRRSRSPRQWCLAGLQVLGAVVLAGPGILTLDREWHVWLWIGVAILSVFAVLTVLWEPQPSEEVAVQSAFMHGNSRNVTIRRVTSDAQTFIDGDVDDGDLSDIAHTPRMPS